MLSPDRGPWGVVRNGEQVFLEGETAKLVVVGNFGSLAEHLAFAQKMAAWMNTALINDMKES